MKLVWLLDPNLLFETDWLRSLLPSNMEEVVEKGTDAPLHTNALVVFNHSIDYETYFKRYEEESIPFAAIHLSDETLGDSIEFYKYKTCQFVVRNYHHPLHSLRYNVITIGLGCKSGYYSWLDLAMVQSTKHRYYHWSFAGNLHDKERLHAVETFQPILPYRIHTTTDGFNSMHNLSVEQYARWLQESKFAICPVGQGNIDSFRFYEACEAGAIPVVLARTECQQYPSSYWHYMFPMYNDVPFPFIIANDWNDARRQMQDILMDKQRYEEMHKKLCRFWYEIKHYWKTLLRSIIETYE